MEKIKGLVNISYLFLVVLFLVPCSVSALPAFPGAEGYGADTPGGRGGRVIAVTNLNDDGPGSLRAALTAKGPRIIIFRVAGNILLKTRIDIKEPFLTVAGQTAPGDGITIGITKTTLHGPLRIGTHDVILRHLRVRSGPTFSGSGQNDALTIVNGSKNIIIDHCSFSWATDENVQTENASNLTIQWSIISEGLSRSSHAKGEHSKGLHFRYGTNISIHHNLLAHNRDRNPNINASGIVDMVNNVFYNAHKWTWVKDKFGSPRVNAIGNFYKKGQASAKNHEIFYYNITGSNPKIFIKGNIGFNRISDDLPENLIVRKDSRFMMAPNRFNAPEVTTYSAFEAFDLVIADAGATLPVRDAHDQRIANDVKNGTGKLINNPSEVGGYLTKKSGTAYVDTDGDGMPDKWEIARCLDPNNPLDGSQDRNGDGYTNVEEFINDMNMPLPSVCEPRPAATGETASQ